MKIQEINGDKLKIYNSIDEMPIERLHKFNKLLLLDSCVGSDLTDVNNHIQKVQRMIDENPANAKIELNNLILQLHFISQEVNPRNLAFYCMVAEINNVPMTDISDDNLNNLMAKYGSVRTGWLRSKVEALKKKLMTN